MPAGSRSPARGSTAVAVPVDEVDVFAGDADGPLVVRLALPAPQQGGGNDGSGNQQRHDAPDR